MPEILYILKFSNYRALYHLFHNNQLHLQKTDNHHNCQHHLNYLHKLEQNGEEYNKADIAASFQDAVTDVLCEHTIEAAEQKNSKIIALAGGVASNSALREKMTKLAGEKGIKVVYPEPILCTDNAVMIACAGYYGYLEKNFADMTLNAIPSLSL